jgi:hypothetical protein
MTAEPRRRHRSGWYVALVSMCYWEQMAVCSRLCYAVHQTVRQLEWCRTAGLAQRAHGRTGPRAMHMFRANCLEPAARCRCRRKHKEHPCWGSDVG